MSKPFSPEEALQSQCNSIPDFVIDAVNAMLSAKYSSGYASINVKEIADVLIAGGHISHFRDIPNHWFNFEPLYRQNGWDVEVDIPGFNEFYSTTFKFRRKQ